MQEIKGNIFDLMLEDGVDSICITTNGIISNNGSAVMGAGIAKAASDLWPQIKINLGALLKDKGNIPHIIGMLGKDNKFYNPSFKLFKDNKVKCLIWSFPTKIDWKYNSIPLLIKKSAEHMAWHANKLKLKKIVVPSPGTGLGKLNYEKDVKPLIEDILDDRFFIISLESEV